ncbi:MAG: MFS transporter [Halofilum sp. (in: g-proteobacteria)]|nr:MFS transporter [Halofilum sp. (in: g-proteobacteria)]
MAAGSAAPAVAADPGDHGLRDRVHRDAGAHLSAAGADPRAHGRAPWLIGANAATMPVGMILAAPLAPRLMRRWGGLRLTAASLLVSTLCLLAIGALAQALAWMPLRLLMGLALACILVVTETWINEIVGDDMRGRVVGFYSAVLSAGFALGPALLALVGSRGWTPFVLGAALPLLALVPLVAVRARLPAAAPADTAVSVWSMLPLAPLLLVCVAAVALADEGAMSFLPIYALRHGYTEHAGTVLLVVMIVGSVSLQYPVGWLADRVRRSTVMAGCAVAAAASAAAFPLLADTPALFAGAVFLWGGVYYGIYVLALIRLGEAFRGNALVAGNAAFAAMWGIGGIAGSAVVGGAMSALGAEGFVVVFVLVFAAIAFAVAAGARRDAAT